MVDYKSPNVTLDDIVFEGRNQAYGAYTLRKLYNNIVTRSLLIGGALFIVAFLLMQFVSTQKGEEAVNTEIDLANLPPPPPVDPNEPPPPPPPPIPPPPKIATIKFVEMEVVKQEEADQEITKVEETEKKVISTLTQEGEETGGNALEVTESGPGLIDEGKEEEPFIVVEQQPEFPGGTEAMYKFMQKNTRFPAPARNANVSGKVFMSFVVSSDGTIKDISVLKGLGYGCDEEAKRVIAMMPKWKAGRQSGRNVPVRYQLPFSFKLESQ